MTTKARLHHGRNYLTGLSTRPNLLKGGIVSYWVFVRLRLADVAASALPELFGASGEKPAWAETTTVPATTTGPEV